MKNQPTKIAVVVDSVQVYKWQKTLIELLSQKENISIFLINLNSSTSLNTVQYYGYYFLQTIDALLFRTPIDALQKQHLKLNFFTLTWLQANEVDLVWDLTGKLALHEMRDAAAERFAFHADRPAFKRQYAEHGLHNLTRAAAGKAGKRDDLALLDLQIHV